MKYFFGWENIKKIVKDLYDTLSSKHSFLSSKRLERLAFTTTTLGLIIGTFIYLIVKSTLTSTDTIMLISPLLLAAGYNLAKGEKEKKDEPEV